MAVLDVPQAQEGLTLVKKRAATEDVPVMTRENQALHVELF